jgi:hypothetical protein
MTGIGIALAVLYYPASSALHRGDVGQRPLAREASTALPP